MRKLLLAAGAASLLATAACSESPGAIVTQCNGQPSKVTPQPNYVMVECENGKIITVPVAQLGQGYTSGHDALHDEWFWLWAMGSNYGSSHVYVHTVSSPIYRTYVPSPQYRAARAQVYQARAAAASAARASAARSYASSTRSYASSTRSYSSSSRR